MRRMAAMQVEAIEPHGMCAGVNGAIARALELAKSRPAGDRSPIYCLHELVHNEIVIGELRDLGFRFVERVADVPRGATVVFSAHGVSPQVRAEAERRDLKVVDATCPFVARVHRSARDFAEKGMEVCVLGDPAHAEVRGIVGEVEDAGGRAFVGPHGVSAAKAKGGAAPLGVVAQTTMNSDEVERAVAELARARRVKTMAKVCGATKDRQDAVRRFCRGAGPGAGVLVLGSKTSSNTRRLAEVAEGCGAKVFTAGDMEGLSRLDFSGVGRLGVTSGASTPERFFMEAMRFLRRVPEHVAIIMDGNGRWAKARGKARSEGHRAGAKTLERVLDWCGERGIRYLTVYAFSTENWKRPKAEVDGLMALFARMLKTKERDFVANRVRFRMVGRRGDLSPKLLSIVESLERKTEAFERQLIVAISYGGRAEIVDAANAAVARGEQVTEETFRRHLYAPDVPDPDLVIRTSGECRVSNFLLWESAYSEYWFTDTLWPDFSEADFDRALESYAARDRRRGGA